MVTASHTEWFSYKIIYLGSISILFTKFEKKTFTFDKLRCVRYYKCFIYIFQNKFLKQNNNMEIIIPIS